MHSPHPSLQKLKPRILVIDDDPSVGVYLSRLFEETGRYSIEVETDSLVAMATASGFRPDLLIVDVFMPGLSGVMLAEQLRCEPQLAACPILFFTGMAAREMPRGVSAGDAPIEYLSKGVSGDELVATVDRLLGVAK
jgi:CheY-like chemotaxis protein